MPNTTAAIVLSTDDKTAAALVATIKGAVNGLGKYAAYVTEHSVTRETVKDHAAALAVLAYPNDAPVQKKDGKRTRFGNAVQAAGNGLRNALDKDDDSDPKPAVLRVSLSGEGGGSSVVEMDSDLGKAILAHLAAEQG